MTDDTETTTIRVTKAQRDAGDAKKPDAMTWGEWIAADDGALDALIDPLAERVAEKLGSETLALSDPASPPADLADAMKTRATDGDTDAVEDRLTCPECGGDTAASLGGARSCRECDWSE